jgi:hypothetical protein
MEERIAVIGLGYVGLPIALAFARRFPNTVGFDLNAERVESLKRGVDATREVDTQSLSATKLNITCNPADLAEATFFVMAVPTPIDASHSPDLTAVLRASGTVGAVLRPGSVVVYESTVYPGVTEDICGPALEKASGLVRGVDFKLGYSPERINPGDREHSFEKIVKVVSGEDVARCSSDTSSEPAAQPSPICRMAAATTTTTTSSASAPDARVDSTIAHAPASSPATSRAASRAGAAARACPRGRGDGWAARRSSSIGSTSQWAPSRSAGSRPVRT